MPGGGVALLNAQTALDKVDLEGDELTGAAIVRRALEEPLKQIAFNAGLEGGVIIEKVRALDPGHGLNAATGEYGDMLKFGVIDPTKVTRSALQNAASIAALVPHHGGRGRREAGEGPRHAGGRHARR